jgi:monofunctional biosynthetic peptidoglycan transglycosylase
MVARLHRKGSLLVAAAVITGVGFGSWLVLPPIDIDRYEHGAPATWAKLQQVGDEAPGQRLRHTFVPLGAIAPTLALAAIVGEDADFFGHGAWDTSAMYEALVDFWHHGGPLRGASTITQQVAKNLYLTADRSWWRKLREARYAYWLDERLGKRRILELYLNIVELDTGIFGVEAGAQHYFGRHAADLDGDEAAALAACIPSPVRHNITTRTAAWRARYRAIRERMQHLEWIRDRLAAYTAKPLQSPGAVAPATDGAPKALPTPPGTGSSDVDDVDNPSDSSAPNNPRRPNSPGSPTQLPAPAAPAAPPAPPPADPASGAGADAGAGAAKVF